jgi:hypothetical protein
VKLLEEAVPPRGRVICFVKLLVEAVPAELLSSRVICRMKLLVEAVPPRCLVSRVEIRANSSATARLLSRRLRFFCLGLVGGNQQITDAEVSTGHIRQVDFRLVNRGLVVLTEQVDKHLRHDPAADRPQFCSTGCDLGFA